MEGIAVVLLTSLWGYLLAVAMIRWRNLSPKGKRLYLEGPFLVMFEKVYRLDSMQLLMNRFHMQLYILNGQAWTMKRSKEEAAKSLGHGYAALTACSWLALLSGEALLLAGGSLAFICLGLRRIAEAGRLLERRKQAIIAALPDRMSKLMLLVGAGETVQNAFIRCMDGKEHSIHPLDKQWSDAIATMRNGQAFGTALELFNRSCAVQEVSLFTTVMLLNYRKGGEHILLALKELSYSLWEIRKGIARKNGEEASSKLVFPLVGIMFILMILVAAPAVLLMA